MIAEIVGGAVVLAIAWAVGTQRERVYGPNRKPNRRITDPLEAGERVRFLCAIPELGIEAGETGRIYMIYPGDDREYWIVADRDNRIRTKIYDYELWQVERL